MKNVIIWEFDNFLIRDIINRLERNNVIKIKKWFVNDKYINDEFFSDKENTINWFKMTIEGMPIKNEKIKIEDHIYNNLVDKFYIFIDLLARHSYFSNLQHYEYVNVINMYIKYFYFILKEEEIDIIIFPDIPHDLPNYILYCVAKEINIKTLILSASIFVDKFNYFFDIEDYGYYKKSEVYDESIKKIKIEKTHKKDLFYMKKIPLKQKIKNKFRMLVEFKKWFNERKEILVRKKIIYKDYYEWILAKIVKTSKNKLDKYIYEKSKKKFFKDIFDQNDKFVYFPLHLQPEMTTSVLGGLYCDQLLAIERLVEIIPDDWFVYVKENPKQTSYMRGKFFFKRLGLIPKTKCIKNNFDTYKLIENSQFVATITGTAGWEAITGGKKVLVFGKAWYAGFPGVFKYNENIKLEDILDFELNHNEIEDVLKNINKKMVKGIYNSDLLEGVSQINYFENEENIYQFFNWIIKNNIGDNFEQNNK